MDLRNAQALNSSGKAAFFQPAKGRRSGETGFVYGQPHPSEGTAARNARNLLRRRSIMGSCALALVVALLSCSKNGEALPEPVPDITEEIPAEALLAQPIEMTLNPYGNAPLSALAQVTTQSPARVQWLIDDGQQIQHSPDSAAVKHRLPILGLRPDAENRVIFTITREDGDFGKDTLAVSTPELPAYLPDIQIIKKQPGQMEPGLTLCGFSYSKDGLMNSRPFIFDAEGTVRWLLEIDALSTFFYPVKRLRNGNWIFGHLSDIYEYDMLGREVNRWALDGYYQHHEIAEKADGNLILAVTDNSLETVNDQIVEISRSSGAIVKAWDLREVMDNDRFSILWNSRDWLHVNSIWYDETDRSLIISARHQGIFKVSYDNELQWILAPHKDWGNAGVGGTGFSTAGFLLTAVDEAGQPYPDSVQLGQGRAAGFDWPWGQHAAMQTPGGRILSFDNGFRRYFQNSNQSRHSRGVEYEVDESARTVRQTWEYGQALGPAFYSRNICDADYLPQSGNRLLASGNIHYEEKALCRIVEVSPAGEVVFEAELTFANLYGSGIDAWGHTDIVYRSERLPLYPGGR